MLNDEIYISVDIEADGPIPGEISMLSLGAAAIKNGQIIDTFSVNFDLLPNAKQDSSTMLFWKSFPQAYAESRIGTVQPTIGMMKFSNWVKVIRGVPVFVAYPVAFDWSFSNWYFHKFIGENPFSFAGMDIWSYAMAKMNCNFWGVSKTKIDKIWPIEYVNPMKHIAVNDAIEQAHVFIEMTK